jgi:ABC-type branched-subunit amino acid transport system ATPase component
VTRLRAVRRPEPSLASDGGALDLRLERGDTATLPDVDAAIAWFAGPRGSRHGEVLEVDGRDLRRRSTASRVRAGLVVVSDPPLAPAVSVRDHLAAATSTSTATATIAQVPHLGERGDDPTGVLSGGERRLLGWARALLLTPRVVVLDRAATGLDAEAVAWATAQVERWRDDGVCVLVRVGRAEERPWVAG